jgi:hypothetical protein
VKDGDLIGLTVLDFDTYWLKRRLELIERIAARFSFSRKEAKEILDRVPSARRRSPR